MAAATTAIPVRAAVPHQAVAAAAIRVQAAPHRAAAATVPAAAAVRQEEDKVRKVNL
jgi:hypothetical protein